MKKRFLKLASLLLLTVFIASCKKEGDNVKKGSGECTYQITIDNQTISPNLFGQDDLQFISSGEVDGASNFTLFMGQTKADGRILYGLELFTDENEEGAFDRQTPVGTTYKVIYFNALEMHLPDLSQYSYNMSTGNTPAEGVLTVTVLENSASRIRIGLSGTIMKKKGGVDNRENVKMVDLDAEFSFNTSYYKENGANGIFVNGAKCDCQQ